MPENDIRHEDGVFFIERDGRRIAELDYRMSGEAAHVFHTWVDPKLRGGGEARRLVQAVVEWARKENRKIVPACSYVRAVFSRSREFDDVRGS